MESARNAAGVAHNPGWEIKRKEGSVDRGKKVGAMVVPRRFVGSGGKCKLCTGVSP